MNILQAMADPKLFGPWFRDPATWAAWRVFLMALFSLDMDREAARLYRRCTGRKRAPTNPASEAWLVVGRRGGKSFILSLIAVFLANFRDWTAHLAPGERGTVMVIATDRRQARVIMRYVVALLEGVPMLARLIERRTSEAVDLSNRITIEVHTASFRSVRGYTIVAALCDEMAFWRTEDAADPDTEILAAVRPSMATVPGAVLLCASTPYARRGALYQAWRDHHGKPGPVLVWRAPTRTMNPTVPERTVKAAYALDPASAAAEYGAEFRSDVEGYVDRAAVDACVVPGRRELPPVAGVRYFGFVDPSGGRADAMTLGVAHCDNGRAVLDAVRERRPPFSPEDVTREFAAVLTSYGVAAVQGDRYAGEWPRERFREHGIEYRPSAKAKSDLYRDLLPVINSGKVELLDIARLVGQLCALERRTARGGRDSIDHPPGAHDDIANVVAGVLLACTRPRAEPRIISLDSARPWELPAFGRGLGGQW